MSTKKFRPIFYDTETTGIRTDKDRIIEIAAFDPVNNLTFEKLINPGISIPPDATRIHNISDEMVANAPGFAQIGKELIEFCQGDVVLIAHNNDAFDFPFLKCEFVRNQLEFPAWKSFDTLKWARRYRNDLPRHTLQFLREVYDIPANNAHRALDDVVVLHKVYTYLTDDLHIDQICDLLNRPKPLLHMPFGKYQGQPLKNIPKDYIEWLMGNGFFDKPENLELKNSFIQLNMIASSTRVNTFAVSASTTLSCP